MPGTSTFANVLESVVKSIKRPIVLFRTVKLTAAHANVSQCLFSLKYIKFITIRSELPSTLCERVTMFVALSSVWNISNLLLYERNYPQHYAHSLSSSWSLRCSKKNAFNLLMQSAKLPALPSKCEHEKSQLLFNDVIDLLEQEWSEGILVTQLQWARGLSWYCDSLWYITHAHDRFSAVACAIPNNLRQFSGYNQWVFSINRDTWWTLWISRNNHRLIC